MLPTTYQLPAAILLVAGGALACFAGYRLFRVVLAMYGFIAGAIIASSMMGSTSAAAMVGAAVAGGLIGAVVMFFAYFLGIAMVGAGLGAYVATTAWGAFAPGEAPWVLVLLFAGLGALAALGLQRYVIIVGTAFSGAWMVVLGAMALPSLRSVRAAQAGVWILYPINPVRGERWETLAWIALGLLGTIVQLATSRTARRRRTR